MFRKGVSTVVLMVLVLHLFCSCAGESSSSVSEDAALEEELSGASEVAELIAIRDELAARAVERGVTPDEIREAAGDVDRSNALFGLSPDEARSRFDRIDALVSSLFERYPALADVAAREEWRCSVCDPDGVARAWEHYSRVLPAVLEGERPGALGAPARPPMICKMTQLIVGFAVCALKSAGSAAVYVVCSYGVFCASCDGGMADIICP